MASATEKELPFDPVTATISDIQNPLLSGSISVRGIVNVYLSRIVTLNPTINAIITLNPEALRHADRLDQTLDTVRDRTHTFRDRPLFGVPILLKDNYDCPPMPTTAGCRALKDCKPTHEAPTVTALKAAGGIILGKTNIHELALEGLTVSSLGGQTLNPWDLTRTPGGSSGGSGAALAAGFCVLATGTDTVNSLRSPASANGMVSCRPTRGLISRAGVVPLSYTHDAVGPMGKTVRDVAEMLSVMASVGYDKNDTVTALRPSPVDGRDFARQLDKGSLRGIRLGVVQGFCDNASTMESATVNQIFDNKLRELRFAKAELIEVRDAVYNSPKILTELDVQRFEYREQLNRYLQRPENMGDYPRSMPELYGGQDFLVIPHQYDMVQKALRLSTDDPEYNKRIRGIEELKIALANTFAQHNLDALIYPEQAELVVKVGSATQKKRNGILGALTGSPVIAIPMHRMNPEDHAPRGLPIGMEILGRPWTEQKLLRIASQIERRKPRTEYPEFAYQSVKELAFDEVPSIVPSSNAPAAYPIGTLDVDQAK